MVQESLWRHRLEQVPPSQENQSLRRVEVQVSARSDLLVVDMIHLTAAFRDGRLDVGVLIVPSDKLSRFLTDRGPCISDAKKHARVARLEDSPLILFAIEHDGAGPALNKQPKRQSGH